MPGIRYVVDTGTARISRYSNRSKVQRLPIEAVSQASAQQRSGRAGRTSDGIAIRLYSEEDFDSRPEFTEPEILRTSLASVILQMLSLGFGDISSFPFLTPPDSRGVKAAFDLLVELGAVRLPARAGSPSGDDRAHPTLTDLGREIARLPIDPRFARMLVEARRTGVLRDVLAIVAGLSIQDVRERPEDRREEADRLHARFTDPTSDFVSLLNLWNHLQEKQAELGSSAFRRLCRAEHLNYVRVREWADVHRQLSTLVNAPRSSVGERAKRDGTGAADADEIHKAILSGLLSQLGILDERTTGSAARGRPSDRSDRADQRRSAEYLGSRGTRFAIFPGSGLKKKRPSAVMAAEVVETSRLFARTVAAIDPEWAEPLAGDLAKRSLSEPHWSKASGAASAYEKVTLFGLEIVPKRRVQLARFDRPFARELFLRHALVEGDWDSDAPRQAPHRLRAAQPGAAPAPREGRRARAAPRHPRGRRGRVPLLRRADPPRRVRRAVVRGVVAGGLRPDAAPLGHDRGRPRRRGLARRRARLPGAVDAGRPGALARVSLRTRCRRRRRHRGRAARAPRPAAPGRVRLAGAGHARRAHHGPAAVASQVHPPPRRARRRLGCHVLGRPRRAGSRGPRRAAADGAAGGARRAHPARRESAGERRGLRDGARARPPAGLVPCGRRAWPRRRLGP